MSEIEIVAASLPRHLAAQSRLYGKMRHSREAAPKLRKNQIPLIRRVTD
jgi:hypothetical protein